MASSDDTDVLVSQTDFEHAFRDLVPSVSQSEMDHYRHIQQRFSRKPNEDPGAEIDVGLHNGLKAGNSMNSSKGKGRAIE